jgi:hypothetical protein
MNDHIKRMWEESTGSVWPRPGKFTAGEYDSQLAKFAELIIRECANVAADHDALDIYEEIREHFEVFENTLESNNDKRSIDSEVFK